MSDSVMLHGFGGGAGLNFDIKAYSTEAAMRADNPRENTICILTERKVAGYTFSNTEPTFQTDGLVWIKTGNFNTVPISITKLNPIMVYPAVTKQYVDSRWQVLPAWTYQKGEWIDWAKYLIVDGDALYEYVLSANLTATEGDGFLSFAGISTGYYTMYISDVDLTNKSVLEVTGEFSGPGNTRKLHIWNNDVASPIWSNSILSQSLVGSSVSIPLEGLTGLYKVGITLEYTTPEKIADFLLF